MKPMYRRMLFWVLAIFGAAPVLAQDFGAVEIEAQPVSGQIYMLSGQGGNIGLSIGDDGAFLIDDQFAPLTDKITAAVRKLTPKPIKFVINTHWHNDHTGGNENLGKAGAIIVAHDNVRKRLTEDQFMAAFNRTVPASPPVAWPVITFADSLTFHWNGETIDVLHVPPAHTDGDSIIHFKQANVLHLGDVYFNGMYPFIDVSSGGSLQGVIEAVDRALTLVNDGTRIIPGHGPLSGVAELRAYREMLGKVGERIGSMVRQGKTLEQVLASKPTQDFDARFGGGFMKPEQWVGIVYEGYARAPGR